MQKLFNAHDLVRAIMAGIAISYGGIAYLSCDNSVVGAFLFSIGLISIYSFHWNLYTGKACYVVTSPPSHLFLVGSSLIGNLIGTVSMGYLFRITKLYKLIPKAEALVEAKLQSNFFGGFILGIGCGFMMYLAVNGFNTIKEDFGKYLVLIMPIIVFTISGYEHVIANMFYFSFANAWSVSNAFYLVIVAFGNLFGCSLVPLVDKFLKTDTHAH